MGRKHTASLKLRKIGNWNNIFYGKRIINQEYKEKQIKKIIQCIFKEWASTAEPVFIYKLNEVKIIIYYWTPKSYLLPFPIFNLSLSKLISYISNLLGLKVNFHLIYLNSPFLSSKILAEFIGMNLKKYRLEKIGGKLMKIINMWKESRNKIGWENGRKGPSFNYKNIKWEIIHKNFSSFISGIKCVLSGRIMKRKSANRRTTQILTKGSFHFNSFPSLIDYRNAYALTRGIGGQFIKNGSIGIKVFINNSIYFH